jgi:spore coat protein CotF
MNNPQWGDKELLHDSLISLKHLTETCNNSILESSNKPVMQIFQQMQKDGQECAHQIWEMMNQRGWYAVKPVHQNAQGNQALADQFQSQFR